ncbi:MAG: CsbD family protein [Alphaproteobacteria bacterium]|nr:CsbD family protein [Alphaproteobacteria bacterium]
MNKDTFEGKWSQLKGNIKKTWGNLTDDDLGKINGQKDKLIGLIQESYGETKDAIEKKVDDLMKAIK